MLATQTTNDDTLWGRTSEVLVFELPVPDFADAPPHVTVDDDGAGVGVVDECDEANNAALWLEPVVCDEPIG